MTPFRGTNECLDREIETLEAIARIRVRRVARELRDIDRDLSELRRERARRRVASELVVADATSPSVES
jgi:hypothetical protein